MGGQEVGDDEDDDDDDDDDEEAGRWRLLSRLSAVERVRAVAGRY